MPGKILILDSVPTNRIVLKVKLSSAFYQVSQASTLNDAITQIRRDPPDLILLSAENCTDGGGVEQCRTLAKIRPGLPIPLLMLSSELTRGVRLAALSAGAEDILAKPLEDAVLFSHIRSLLRAREASQDLRLRERTTRALGFSEDFASGFSSPAQVVFASGDPALGLRWRTRLKPLVPYGMRQAPHRTALSLAHEKPQVDAYVIAIDRDTPDVGLRLLAEIRAHSVCRHSGVLVVIEKGCDTTIIDALDLGASAIMTEGFDPEEMALRLAAIIQQKRLRDRHDRSVRDGLHAAVTDPLTGLFNRRYALPQLRKMAMATRNGQRDLAVLVADLDHFKQVNDRFGHATGDDVLKQVARTLRSVLRPVDLLARIGGEEFLIALPAVNAREGRHVAEKLCDTVRHTPVSSKSQKCQLAVTVSIGMEMASDLPARMLKDPQCDIAGLLLNNADKALYGAKATGRNQVTHGAFPSSPASGLA